MHKQSLLEISDLSVWFSLEEGTVKAVDKLSMSVPRKRTVGVIGESGCGKSITARAIMRLIDRPGRIIGGQMMLRVDDTSAVEVTSLDPNGQRMRAIRGRDIAMIFQEPMTSLSPVHTIGNQIGEAVRLNRTRDRQEIREIVMASLERVGMSNPSQRYGEYPYQLSGGMRQRAMIAMALSCRPSLLIADEPTTALDVTVQAQILELMQELQAEREMSILFITHDLGVIAEMAEEVYVMYLGRVVESGPIREVFERPAHPYTRGLLKSMPQVGPRSASRLETIEGVVPVPLDLPVECGFRARCAHAMAGMCDTFVPALTEIEDGHFVRCFLHSNQKEDQHE